MENEDKDNRVLEKEIELMFKRIIDSHRLKADEILVLCQYGAMTGLTYLNEILKDIDEKGEKAAGKKYSSQSIDFLINSIRSEFYFRTSHFYAEGHGHLIPEELGLAFIKLVNVIYDLESEMLYGNQELNDVINQKELAYLFAALSHQNIFHSSANLLAQSLESITNYSEESIRRVILDFKKTSGGWSKQEKEKLLKKLSDAIDSF